MRIITLKYDAECKQCGAFLPVGSKAKWYGRGNVYGVDCHATGKHRIKPAPTLEQENDFTLFDLYDEMGIRTGAAFNLLEG